MDGNEQRTLTFATGSNAPTSAGRRQREVTGREPGVDSENLVLIDRPVPKCPIISLQQEPRADIRRVSFAGGLRSKVQNVPNRNSSNVSSFEA